MTERSSKASIATTKITDDKELESSRDDESEWGFKKLLKKDQIKLQDSFRLDTENILKYLTTLKAVMEAFQKLNVSGKSYHFDMQQQVPNSGWRYMSQYLKKVEFIGQKNKDEMVQLTGIYNKIGLAEERGFGKIRNPDEKYNIFLASGENRVRMEKLDQAITVSLKTCNRRRKKVEKAAIIHDLRDQCPKYKMAIFQLDAECRDLENYKLNVRNNFEHYHTHIKKSLCVTADLSKKKAAIVAKEKTKNKDKGGKGKPSAEQSGRKKERSPSTEAASKRSPSMEASSRPKRD